MMKGTTLVLCVALSLGLASQAVAGLITFTHAAQGSITGTLDGVPFVATEMLITATGDNDNRQSFGTGFFIDHDTANISIPGLGSFDFVTGTRTFINNQNQIVGFSRAGFGGADLMNGPTDPSFATWDMLSSIGPITGLGETLQWTIGDILTTGGVLVIDDVGLDITGAPGRTAGAIRLPDADDAQVVHSRDYVFAGVVGKSCGWIVQSEAN